MPLIASNCIPHQVNARAASALSELARDNPANQSAAAQAGGIAPFVALLQGSLMTRESRRWPLCTRPACTLHASAHHSATFVCLEGDGAESAKKATASALWTFSVKHPQNQAAIAEARRIAPLVALLGGRGAEMQLQAAGALAALVLDNPQNQSTIATMLVQLFTAPDTPTRTKASRAISNLARAHTSIKEELDK